MQNEINLNKTQKIIIILHALDALEEFKKEYYKEHYKEETSQQSIYEFINSAGEDTMNAAFLWRNTEKGYNYWAEINHKIHLYIQCGSFVGVDKDTVKIKNNRIKIRESTNHCYLVDVDNGIVNLKDFGIYEDKFEFCGIPVGAGGQFPWHDSLAKINETIIKIIAACDMPKEAMEPLMAPKTKSEPISKSEKKQQININFKTPKTLICKL